MQSKGVKINEEFYEADRESLLLFKDMRERLSSNFLKYEIPEHKYHKEACAFFVKNFYAIFHYITSEFEPVISIDPNTTSSWCAVTQNKIQLGTKLLDVKNAKQQDKVDATFAVMLHEMFHKRYTNIDLMRAYFPEAFTLHQLYTNSTYVTNFLNKIFVDETFRSIFNVLEDRRIERLGINEFPGYVFYFDSLRKFVFDIHLEREHVPDNSCIINYLLYSILLPELKETYTNHILDGFNKSLEVDISKKEFIQISKSFDTYIDRNKSLVFSDDVAEVIEATKGLYDLIPKSFIGKMKGKTEYNRGPMTDIEGSCAGSDGFIGKDGHELAEFLEELIDELNKEYNPGNGDVNNYHRSRTEKISIIDCSKSAYENVEIFNPKCSTINVPIYNQAKIISRDIARNLGFISSRLNAINQEFELNEGDIDEDELYSIAFSSNIFYNEEPKPGFSFDLGILIDESGSMAGIKKINAITAALGCILGAKDNNHVNLFVYGHSNSRHRGISDGVELYEYFNKKRGVSDWKNIFAVGASGGNADGYAIAKVGEIMMSDSKSKNKILIVISDGYPSAKEYGGASAENHVKTVVDMLDTKGIEIVQICIDNIDSSPKMFKNYIPFDNIGNFINKFKNFLQTKLVRFSEEI